MTRVRVRLFGPARQAAGVGEAEVELREGGTAGDVVAELRRRFPALAELLPRSRVAVNLDYVDATTSVRSGDEVAIIPPVGGG